MSGCQSDFLKSCSLSHLHKHFGKLGSKLTTFQQHAMLCLGTHRGTEVPVLGPAEPSPLVISGAALIDF